MKYLLVVTNQYKLIAIRHNLNKKEYKCKTKRQSIFFSNFTFEIFLPRIPLERLSLFRSPFVGNALTIKGVKKICRVYREEYSSNKMISFSSQRLAMSIEYASNANVSKTKLLQQLVCSPLFSFSLFQKEKSVLEVVDQIDEERLGRM